MALLYLDSSALVKLIRAGAETRALREHLDGVDLISSSLVLTELPRAIRRAHSLDPDLPLDALIDRAGDVIDACALVPLDDDLLSLAGALDEPNLRSLDAIHVASATAVAVDEFVSYDDRRRTAAGLAGLRTTAPTGSPSRELGNL